MGKRQILVCHFVAPCRETWKIGTLTIGFKPD
jgi:hypothetical protein